MKLQKQEPMHNVGIIDMSWYVLASLAYRTQAKSGCVTLDLIYLCIHAPLLRKSSALLRKLQFQLQG